jgi:hypothetical protein
MKFRENYPVGAEFFHLTDITKLTYAFCCCFVITPKKTHLMGH